jgi:hypothetical protein
MTKIRLQGPRVRAGVREGVIGIAETSHGQEPKADDVVEWCSDLPEVMSREQAERLVEEEENAAAAWLTATDSPHCKTTAGIVQRRCHDT